ncbi:hypothetical protein CDG77_10475 [Nostoc sp. 'Peltigera membranacea cyanobiont' 213]|uniref:hypothetical protein n=1 Tax=Nostoc sp. 'Peltigera membranacea cyanobiont' 213 TaxID=2014530 RepID=UPI000B953459|nr:hypothetical protein [Nostoc sp. 'Peltigera membranacea cyanobiont' 213]OYD95147.1 hypothetical protein CDG77_10475 [Nostoc sp. 'Peltigera membranacea cyanobiont' 213]
MTYITHTQQASPSFSVDEQALAQAELYTHLETQAEAVAPTQDPLTNRDRRIIGEIIEVEPETVRTIWIEGGITVWVQLVGGGRLPFDRNCFATRVAEVKATLPETPLERNERLSDELEKACTVFGLYHGEIDWLSFSTKLFQDGHFVGFVGCNQQGWYARPRQYGVNRVAGSAKDVIALLGVRTAVAA